MPKIIRIEITTVTGLDVSIQAATSSKIKLHGHKTHAYVGLNDGWTKIFTEKDKTVRSCWDLNDRPQYFVIFLIN